MTSSSGSQTATTASTCRPAGTTTARSARSTSRPGKVVWKFDTPQPERGGPTTTASGLGFDGGGDGVFRAFDAKTGQVLWTFQTGYQIADGPSVYSVNGVEFVAIGGRRHRDLVERRHGRFADPGLLARRQRHSVAAADDHHQRHAGRPPARGALQAISRQQTTRLAAHARATPVDRAGHGADRPRRRAPGTRTRRTPSGRGPRHARRSARRRRGRQHRRLGRPHPDRRERRLHLSRRHHHRRAPCGDGGRRQQRDDRRPPADGGAARRAARARRRDQRRLRRQRPVRRRSTAPVTWSIDGRLTDSAGDAPPPVLLYSYELRGVDHRRQRQPRRGRGRHDPHERPPVLDAVAALRRQTAATRRSSSQPTRRATTPCRWRSASRWAEPPTRCRPPTRSTSRS